MSSPAANEKLSQADERSYTSLGNILGILGFLPSLIVLLMYKDRSEFLSKNMKNALNFQISFIIYEIVLFILISILSMISWFFFTLGFIYWVIWIPVVIFSIIAFTKTKEGEDYNYPLSIKLIK